MALSDDEKQVLKTAADILIRECANDGEKVGVRGFGTFTRKRLAARTARDPKTGGTVEVPSRSVLRFSASKNLTNKD